MNDFRQPHRNALQWRDDIDGLRAVAVLAVILFHAGFTFMPGGFTGVDVFFVISGFLIGRQIIGELHSGEFSFVHFWFRRARRILPALLIMCLITLATGWFILMPNDLKDTGRSALAQSLFASNIYFWLKADYFATPALLKPLLHTWTLSLEEQFYLLAPAVLVLLHRLGRAALVAGILVLLAMSLIASATLTTELPAAAFYLLPFRAWELLAGVALAVWAHSAPALSHRTRQALGMAGLALIAAGFLMISEHSIFPGYLAMLPVAGTAAIIVAGAGPGSMVSEMLSHPSLVVIGRASYSLYLWHWPVFVYLRYAFGNDLPLGLTVAALALTAFLGLVSWRFIEQPARRMTLQHTGSLLLISAATASAALALAGHALDRNDGFASRLPSHAREIYQEAFGILHYDEPCFHPAGVDGIRLCGTARPGTVPDILVWGDSHTWAIAPALTELSSRTGQTYARYQCIPVLNTFRADQASSLESSGCTMANERMLDYIRDNRIPTVLLVAAWSRLVEPRELLMEGAGKRDQFISGLDGPSRTSAEAKAVFAREFPATLDRLTAAGASVWILEQVPQHTAWIANEAARDAIYGSSTAIHRPLREHTERQAFISNVFQQLAEKDSRVHVLAPQPLFCDAATCRATQDGKALYFDFHHLSIAGARVIQPLLAPLFEAQSR